MQFQEKIKQTLKVEDKDGNAIWIKSTRTLRQLIGVLGMLLPLLLVVFSTNCAAIPLESISHYFYTRSGTIFVVILSLVGIFLILYVKDFYKSSLAGICALCVVFFPTDQLSDIYCTVVKIPPSDFRQGFHYATAAIFLSILAYILLFEFTKPDNDEQKMDIQKVSYKQLYKICGSLMVLALLVMGVRALGEKYKDALEVFVTFYDANQFTFWMEVLALEAFGIGWLVKGRNSVKPSEIETYRSRKAL